MSQLLARRVGGQRRPKASRLEGFAQSALPVVLVLTVGIWLNSMAVIPFTLLHAQGRPRVAAIFHLAELVLYIGALWWLTDRFGIVGAALAWLARVALDLVLLHVAARRILMT